MSKLCLPGLSMVLVVCLGLLVGCPPRSEGPIAAFVASPRVGDEPLTVQFTDQSSAGNASITSWTWDFGDGLASIQKNPSHSYDSVGTYTVSLTVTTPVGSDTETKPGHIAVFGGAGEDGPPAGNPAGDCPIPPDAALEDTSTPDHVIGDGTPESCTAEAFIEAVAQGGTIIFDGGPDPVTITLDRPAKVFNNANPDVVIDGGGLVTLSGGGTTRILYMNTCDPDQVWTTAHCQDQDHPRLTVQNLTFADGNSKSETEYDGGGAIWVRGGRFKVVNCRFFRNVCVETGSDVGGAAIRVFSQFQSQPVYVVNSTFGGAEGYGNAGANGGGINSIGVSWTIINCLFSHNRAANSGGAIYNDGNTMTLSICGTLIQDNEVNAYGAAIFFTTNDHTGNIIIDHSVIRNNIGGSWYTLPGISMHGDTAREITNSVIE